MFEEKSNNSIEMMAKRELDIFLDIITGLKSKRSITPQQLMILCCSIRMDNSFKATILLTKSNLYQEAYSALRNAFDAIVIMSGAWRYPSFENYKKKLHVQFLFDKLEVVSRSKFIGNDENADKIISEIENEIIENYKIGIERFGMTPIEVISNEINLSELKYRYYRPLSLDIHASLYSIQKFVDYDKAENTVRFHNVPKNDKTEVIFETLYNFVHITNSILNSAFSLNMRFPDAGIFFSAFETPKIEIMGKLKEIRKNRAQENGAKIA